MDAKSNWSKNENSFIHISFDPSYWSKNLPSYRNTGKKNSSSCQLMISVRCIMFLFSCKFKVILQVMLPCSRPGHLYCIDVESTNAGIPYADSFSILTHYCINNISENETSFAIFSQIKYKKSVWGIMKSKFKKLKAKL